VKTTGTAITTWLFIGLIILIALFVILSLWNIASTTHFGEIDFMGYWSATYLLSNGENPYSMERMEEVQRLQVHSTLDVTIMAWNPPFLFTFLLPLAWMSFDTAKFVWLVINIITIITAGLMLIYLYMPEVSPRFKLIFLAFVIGFPAAIAGLYMGQVTFLVFLGLVACMALIKKEQWFLAGAVLILTMIKPHMVVLPMIYLLVYMAQHRQYRGWVGLAFAVFTCLSILLIFRANLIYDLLGETAIARVSWATSTIGGLFSYLGLSEGARYLILVLLPLPLLLAKYPEKFNMELSVALLTLITVPTTFFGWSYDQTILLIPIAQVFSWLVHSKYRLPIFICITCAMIVNYYQRLVTINDVYYVWVPLFWWAIFGLVWYNSSLEEGHHA
jgi:hypothetical protein